MKSIAIVGAGICGCTTYLFLKKHLSPHIPDLDIHIYESYPPPAYLSSSRSKAAQSNSSNDGSPEERPNLKPSPSDVTIALGGALGLSPNGFRVFESLDPKIGKRIQDAGVEVDSFAMQLSSGRMLGDFPAGGKRHGHGTVLVMRASLHDAVLERVDGKDITFGKKVRKVVDGEKTVRIEFEDEECLEADLVIGADGVWGETRKAIPECADLKAEYDGMVGIGAFLDETTTRNMMDKIKSKKGLVIPKNPMTMTFGSGAFFGTIINTNALDGAPPKAGLVTTGKDLDRDLPYAGWWSTFPMDPAPSSRTPFLDLKAQVLAKHKDWTPLIPAMIENSGLDGNTKGTFVLPRWITPSLAKWTSDSGRILLAGDAAHCMPPDSGQGVSCAVEDAMTIGLLSEAIFALESSPKDPNAHNETEHEQLERLCDLYTKVRKPRCEHVVAEARKRGDMKRELKWWEETLRNLFIFAACKIMPQSAMDAFFSWDVETEVNKVLSGKTPAITGKGKIDVQVKSNV